MSSKEKFDGSGLKDVRENQEALTKIQSEIQVLLERGKSQGNLENEMKRLSELRDKLIEEQKSFN